jgi:hypothetical protein
MHRRIILKGMAAIIALQSHPLARFAAKGATTPAFSRVRPGDAAWPSAASWAKLSEAVGGNLISVQSPFGACASDPESAPCADALRSILNPFYIGDQPGGTQVSATSPLDRTITALTLGAGVHASSQPRAQMLRRANTSMRHGRMRSGDRTIQACARWRQVRSKAV